MAWVLIVDDDASIRDSLEFALHIAGYAIVEVGDGEDALDVLRATPYHAVVLLDLLMPGMTGQKVLDLLEQDPQLACRHGWIIMSADYEALQSIPLQQRADLGLRSSRSHLRWTTCWQLSPSRRSACLSGCALSAPEPKKCAMINSAIHHLTACNLLV